MKIKWQWFIGGRNMFWISILMMVGLVLGFLATYVINPTEKIYMKKYI